VLQFSRSALRNISQGSSDARGCRGDYFFVNHVICVRHLRHLGISDLDSSEIMMASAPLRLINIDEARR
jgi:hypothetical protein